MIFHFVTPAQAGVGLYSVSVASQNNTYYTCLNIVNFIDPIPAFAGMTKKENRNDKGNYKTTPACGHPSTEGNLSPSFRRRQSVQGIKLKNSCHSCAGRSGT